jgi:hypothetical protein
LILRSRLVALSPSGVMRSIIGFILSGTVIVASLRCITPIMDCTASFTTSWKMARSL